MCKRSVDAKRRAAQLSNSAERLEYLEHRILRIRHPHAIGQGQTHPGRRGIETTCNEN